MPPTTTVVDNIPHQAHLNIKRWWKYRNLRNLNLLLSVPLLTSFTLGFDGSMFGALQASDAWQKYFDYPTGADLASLGAAPTIAAFAAIALIPFTSDRLGRRWSLFIGCLFIILGGALQAGAATLAMYGTSRAFIGFGSVWCQTSGIAWVVELAHPRQRATATAIFFTSYAIGSVIAAWVVFGTVHISNDAAWRVPSALQCVPAIFQACLCFFCPDSPRHLYSRGKIEEAKAIIVKYHSEGVEDELAHWEFTEIQLALDAEKSLTKGFLKPLKEAFETKGNRKRIFLTCWLAVCSQASGNSFISYYFSPVLRSVGITSELTQTLINATSQILSWISALGFAFLPGRVGRRPLFLVSLAWLLAIVVGMTAASAVYANEPDNKSASYAVIALVYLFSPAYNLGFNGNFTTYISEINPFHVRTTALALQQLTTNCVQLIFQYATPIGLENLGWKYFIVHVPWIVVEFIVIYFFLPETKGYALEEISILFDGDSAALHSSTVRAERAERAEDEEIAKEKGAEIEHVRHL